MVCCLLMIFITMGRPRFHMDNHLCQPCDVVKEIMAHPFSNGVTFGSSEVRIDRRVDFGVKPVPHPAHTDTTKVTDLTLLRDHLFGLF